MGAWVIDPDHTVAAFFIRHFMVSDVHGQFNRLSGVIRFDPGGLSTTSVDIEMESASLWTGIQKRDEHLKSPDFFDVTKYPKILFSSTGAEVTGSNRFRVTGELTIRDLSRPVTFDCDYFGPVDYLDETEKSTTYGFRATAVVDRNDFGLTWNMSISPGNVAVGRYVHITINAEADATG